MGFHIALLVYASTSEEVNSKFVEFVGNSLFSEGIDPCYSRKDNFNAFVRLPI